MLEQQIIGGKLVAHKSNTLPYPTDVMLEQQISSECRAFGPLKKTNLLTCHGCHAGRAWLWWAIHDMLEQQINVGRPWWAVIDMLEQQIIGGIADHWWEAMVGH